MLLVGGVAYALTIECDGTGDQDPAPLICAGTADSDTITGTANGEEIYGEGGNDKISALAGDDLVVTSEGKDRVSLGAGNDHVDAYGGNDVIYGGPDGDGNTGDPSAPFLGVNLEGAEQSDVVYGEDGDDIIDAATNDTPGARDRSVGGAGNDQINAADGNKDVINCGAGAGDLVVLDEQDTQRNCESLVAP